MVNINYGGRHTTNLIDDVISPQVLKRAADDRTGLNNFRPFEELGRNLRQAYTNPGNNVLSISVRQIHSSTPVNVNLLYRKSQSFTYVPPVSSFASFGYSSEGSALSESLRNYFDNIGHSLSRAYSKVALLISVYVISPVLSVGTKSKTLLFGHDYKVGEPTMRFGGITWPAFFKTSLVVAAIGVSSVLFIRGINDPGAAPGITTESNSSTTTIRNGANRKPDTQPSTSHNVSAPSAIRETGSAASSSNNKNSSSNLPVTSTNPSSSSTGSPATSSWPTAPIGGNPDTETPPTTSTTPPTTSPTSPLPALPVIDPTTLEPTLPVLINDPILSQPLLP